MEFDLRFMMVMLSDEDLVVDELDDIDERAHVYFAMDPSERFGVDGSQSERGGPQSDVIQSRIHNRYADRRRAILAAKPVWMELRRTTLSPEAIATALVPINSRPHAKNSALG
jgi:hypothetical protein